MQNVIARIKVVLTAAVTWLVAASLVVTIVSSELADVLSDGTAETVAAVSLKIVAWLGAAVSIIRRVTPVLPDQVGLLPPDGDAEEPIVPN